MLGARCGVLTRALLGNGAASHAEAWLVSLLHFTCGEKTARVELHMEADQVGGQ